ncbi:hypothetical protein B0F90DRAFT_1778230 [Multifurca ochricompacta]|uniref:CFEM domain-containing protein n=1 Tax=Multifurca ochricompacta TaxID=376703 RepID=A0AAD4LWT1_9AGAM|nr:hypothetical protein B0F90DRAFT_1778230 [Multifurca ochricompacta]
MIYFPTFGHFSLLTSLFLFLLSIVPEVSSQTTLPDCVQLCANNASANSGCDLTDTSCVCNTPSFATTAGACIATQCPPADLQAAQAFFQNLCSQGSSSVPVSSSGTDVTSPSTSGVVTTTAITSGLTSVTPSTRITTTTPTSRASTTGFSSSSVGSTTITRSTTSSTSSSSTPSNHATHGQPGRGVGVGVGFASVLGLVLAVFIW